MMMAEYIERKAAIREMYKEPSYYDPINILTEVRDRIRAIPAADVLPVVHGRWEQNHPNDNIFYCNQCAIPNDTPTNYCPSCGARMEGVEDGTTDNP